MDSKTLLEIANSEELKQTINELIEHYNDSTSNPHKVTKQQIGLGNVENTSDANKPISAATQAALSLKLNTADLIEDGKIKTSFLPGTTEEVIDCYVVEGTTPLSNGWLTTEEGGTAFIPSKSVIYTIIQEGNYKNKVYRWSGTTYVCLNELDLSNYLPKNNTDIFIPSGAYNPATKKYIDDLVNPGMSVVSHSGAISQTISRERNIIEVIGDIHEYTTEELAGEYLSEFTSLSAGKYVFLSFNAPLDITPDSNLEIVVTDFNGTETTYTGTEALSGGHFNIALAVNEDSRAAKLAINWGNGDTYETYVKVIDNAITNKISKVASATEDNLVSFDTNGGIKDSGSKITDFITKRTAITAATKCKVTYDENGLITSGADLTASDIPNLTLSKITDITASATELNYCDGVTSNIQTQLNNKLSSGGTAVKATADGLGNNIANTYQKKASATSVTISVEDWNSGTSVIKTITGVTITNTVIVSAADKSSDTTCGNYGIFPSAQGSGNITFVADSTPNASVTLNILILE